MFKKLIALFIVLSSLKFFNFVFLGESITKIIEIAGVGVTLAVIILQQVYQEGEGFKMNFSWGVGFIFISLVTSTLMADSAHNQSIPTTLIAQRFMYFYLFYFALHNLKVSDTEVERILLYMGVLYSLFYFVQYFAYPKIIFNVRVDESRGTIRIFQDGLSYLILSYFYILNKNFEKVSIQGIGIMLLFLSVVVLMATRQLIAAILLLTIINILASKRVKSKILILVLVAGAMIPVGIMFNDVITNMIELSSGKGDSHNERIRIVSGLFFLTEFFPNDIAYITGNGVDSMNSGYGMMIQYYKDAFGFFQSDVGLIGDFSKFGIFFLVGVIIIYSKVFLFKFSEKLKYIKFYFLFSILTAVTGDSIFGQGCSIVAVSMVLYLMDINKHDQAFVEENELTSTSEVPLEFQNNPTQTNYKSLN